MRRKSVLVVLLIAVLLSCQQIGSSSRVAPIELRIKTATPQVQIQPRLGELRQGDVSLTSTSLAVQTDGQFDYVQIQFAITNNSSTAFDNLTLYALAKNGNVGGSAIQSINSFSGIATSEQVRVARLMTPVHGVDVVGNVPNLVAARADLQVFEPSEIADLQNLLNTNAGGFSSNDKVLGYGFVARRCMPDCTAPSSFVRDIPAFGTTGYNQGLVTVALRLPRTNGTPYDFTMSFAMTNRITKSVTKSLYPPETLANAEARLAAFGGTAATDQVVQFGLGKDTEQSDKINKGVYTVTVATDASLGNADYAATLEQRVAAGAFHACGLTAQGTAKCWGGRSFGSLADGSSSTTPLFVSSAAPVAGSVKFASLSALCGISTTATLYCWGLATQSNSPVPIVMAPGIQFKSIHRGIDFYCGLSVTGLAYCWGNNTNGALGVGDTVNRNTPTQVRGGIGFSSLSVGAQHVCGISFSETVYCWGQNGSYQLNLSDNANRTVPTAILSTLQFKRVSAGNNYTCGVDINAKAHCWGSNNYGKLGVGDTNIRTAPTAILGNLDFAKIYASQHHTCGITTNFQTHCWGRTENGMLGIGSTTDESKTSPQLVSGSFVDLSLGDFFTLGVTNMGEVYGWGQNVIGQLSLGDTTDRDVPTYSAAHSLRY
jgi:hypothetical protein